MGAATCSMSCSRPGSTPSRSSTRPSSGTPGRRRPSTAGPAGDLGRRPAHAKGIGVAAVSPTIESQDLSAGRQNLRGTHALVRMRPDGRLPVPACEILRSHSGVARAAPITQGETAHEISFEHEPRGHEPSRPPRLPDRLGRVSRDGWRYGEAPRRAPTRKTARHPPPRLL